MNGRKLAKLRGEAAQMRRSPQKARDLESLAERLGRGKVKRGKEPMWESTEFSLPPIAIPHHGGRDLSPGVRNNILNCLEDDLLAWEDWLDENGQDDEAEDED